MQAFVTPDNFIFSVLEESPRIGGFICFLKTLKNFEAGSGILPLLSKCDLNKNKNTITLSTFQPGRNSGCAGMF